MAVPMIQSNPESAGTYTYSSQPRPVHQGKYRDDAGYGNIMYDRRVVRGNTYALHTLPASSQPDPLELQHQQEARRRTLARKRAHEQFKPRSPDPVEGRRHINVQTELYLEEITDRIEEADVQTQTDAFLDRPPTPLFIPAKTGLDIATQIEDGDLFDFDLEVKPILEVLVGKILEQSLLEVMEEEELASLRAQQRVFEENRKAEVVETQRLEEQERRRQEEKQRRMKQRREALLKEKETAEKIAARAFAQSYLSDLVPSVFSTLSHNGFFYDPVEREIENVFLPWLVDEVEKTLDKKLVARMLLDAMIREVVAKHLGVDVTVLGGDSATPPVANDEVTASDAQPTTQENTLPQPSTDSMDTDNGGTSEPLSKVFGNVEDGTNQPSGSEKEEEAIVSEKAADEDENITKEPSTDPPAGPTVDPPTDSSDPPSTDLPADPSTDQSSDPTTDANNSNDLPQATDPPLEGGDKPPDATEDSKMD